MSEYKLYQVIVTDSDDNIIGKSYVVAESERDAIRAFCEKQTAITLSLLVRFSCFLEAYEVTDKREYERVLRELDNGDF